MAVKWDVIALDVTKTVGSLSDVVTNVHWTASDTDENRFNSTYSKGNCIGGWINDSKD